MTRFPRISAVLLIPGILAAPAIVRGDTITITSGAAMSRTNQLYIVDVAISSPDHGFSLTAAGDAFSDEYWLYDSCHNNPGCMPGKVLSLFAWFCCSDFHGTATADGMTFRLGSGDSGAGVIFEGSWTVPAFTGATTTTVIAPFTFTGWVDYPYDPPNPFPRHGDGLVGSGLTTIDLVWHAQDSAWSLAGARYEFVPTPEPGTLLLVAPLALGLVRRHSITRRARS
jgi:hypothetical protein